MVFHRNQNHSLGEIAETHEGVYGDMLQTIFEQTTGLFVYFEGK